MYLSALEYVALVLGAGVLIFLLTRTWQARARRSASEANPLLHNLPIYPAHARQNHSARLTSVEPHTGENTAFADAQLAVRMVGRSLGTPIQQVTLDTATIGLDPEDRRLQPFLTELEHVSRPVDLAQLFSSDDESDHAPTDILRDMRRQVLQAYRAEGVGACLIVPLTGRQNLYFDLRLGEYTTDLQAVSAEIFETIKAMVPQQSRGVQEAENAYGAMARLAPPLVRRLSLAIRDLSLPPAFDYLRGEVDAYSAALNGRMDQQRISAVLQRYGRLDLEPDEYDAAIHAPTRLLCLLTLIAVWDMLILNFCFRDCVERR